MNKAKIKVFYSSVLHKGSLLTQVTIDNGISLLSQIVIKPSRKQLPMQYHVGR